MIKYIALLSPVYVTLFWCLILLIQIRKAESAKTYLGLFMLFMFIMYCTHIVFFSNLYQLYSFLESVYIFTLLSVFPLFYFYLIQLTSQKVDFKKCIIHFIPAFLFGLVSLSLAFILTPEERISYVQETLINKNLKELDFSSTVGVKGEVFFISRVFFIIQVIMYTIQAVRTINIHNHRILDYYSNTEGKTLNWIRLLSIVFLFIASVSISLSIIGRSIFVANEARLLIPSGIFTIWLFIIGFKGNQQISLSSEMNIEDALLKVKVEPYDILKQKLILLFTKDKIYTNPELRITSVSDALRTNRTYVSKLINEEFKMNFNEFVNNYRINEAKKLLTEKRNDLYSMDYIAEKSGFGSINSFTRVFKSIVGETPGNFRIRYKIQDYLPG